LLARFVILVAHANLPGILTAWRLRFKPGLKAIY
jgi:hypothetical protein